MRQAGWVPELLVAGKELQDEITAATYKVLAQVGIRFVSERALNILRDAGADVQGDIVKLPMHLVEKALSSTPSNVSLYSIDAKYKLDISGRNQFYGTGSDCPFHLDTHNGRRPARLLDVEKVTRLTDALSNIDFVMCMGLASDVPREIADRYHFKIMVENTRKPILFTAYTLQSLREIYRLAETIRGSESFMKEPFACIYLMSSPPLQHSEDALEKLMWCAEHYLPLVYATAPLAGVSGPITNAGRIVVGNAEILSALVLHQLVQPGAPFIYGVGFGVLDMKTAVNCYCAPEHLMSNMFGTQLAHGYGIPVFGYAGFSDSKLFDEQAGLEIGLTTLAGALSGANLLHDVGYLESGMLSSMESVVLTDEIIGLVRVITNGLTISEEDLAIDCISRVGPAGSYLTDPHTMAHLKDIWYPNILDRRGHDAWVSDGKTSLGERLREKATRILEEHNPTYLEPDVKTELEEIAKSW